MYSSIDSFKIKETSSKTNQPKNIFWIIEIVATVVEEKTTKYKTFFQLCSKSFFPMVTNHSEWLETLRKIINYDFN